MNRKIMTIIAIPVLFIFLVTACTSKEDISEETSLYNDLGVDSLGVISMGIRLQAKFNVKIPPAIAAEFRTVGDIYDQLKKIEAEED